MAAGDTTVGSTPNLCSRLLKTTAVLVGLVSHVSGGLGVFEVIVLATFPSHARTDALAAMLCYRVTYSLVPFALAGIGWLVFESRRAGKLKR